jgi:hypothetical protein
MSNSSLNSLLLASTDPDRLHAWYVAAFEPSGDTKVNGYRVLTFGSFKQLRAQRRPRSTCPYGRSPFV